MRDLLRTGADWLNSKLGEVASHAISYRRVGETALSIPASVGKSVFEESSAYGVFIKTETRDFLILATNLTLGIPLRGDVIADSGILYEVISPTGEPCYRWSDPDGKTLRIHTKEIGLDG